MENNALERITPTKENLVDFFSEFPDHQQRYEFAIDRIDGNMMVADMACGVGYGTWLMSKKAGFVVGDGNGGQRCVYSECFGVVGIRPIIVGIASGVCELIAGHTHHAIGGAVGGGNDKVFWENDQVITTNYTITNGKNAGTFGPITINSGVTVTVGDGETWTVI